MKSNVSEFITLKTYNTTVPTLSVDGYITNVPYEPLNMIMVLLFLFSVQILAVLSFASLSNEVLSGLIPSPNSKQLESGILQIESSAISNLALCSICTFLFFLV